MEFPQELVEAIFDLTDRKSVRNLALTAHRFVPFCRRILFSKVRLCPSKLYGIHIQDRAQQLVDILQVSPQITQFMRDVEMDVDTLPFPGFEELLLVCMAHMTSPHRVAFDGRRKSWDSFSPELVDAITTMIRRPTLCACSLLSVEGFPFSVFNNSQFHTLELREVSFSLSGKPASSLLPVIVRPIRLRHLEYVTPSSPTAVVLCSDSVQQLCVGFDLSNLKSLALTITQHIPEIATLLTDCSKSLQSLTFCGEIAVDLSPLSRIRNLVLDVYINSTSFKNDTAPLLVSIDDNAPLLVSIATLKTLDPSRSMLRNVTLDLCLTKDGIRLFSADTWHSFDITLFRLLKDRHPPGTVTLKLGSLWNEATRDVYSEFMMKLPKCQEAGLLVHSATPGSWTIRAPR
ncbi:hypothetical protein BDN72DRAFT_849634 [Pluteus cervinus]|uniref:Uncharacterized protein n=1 Tax=Pluteus cervinus TaxID=181527 RepID=A0ACD3A7T9_9AGAR|nr:hypothetical protein BDN72DRAFT_849634 [Pluteus cervinus]